MITFKHKGNFKKTDKFLNLSKNINYLGILEKYAQEGLQALYSATPVNSGETRDAWGYEISSSGNKHSIFWTNSNFVDGVSIAIILQYGHATKNGGFVSGLDYINPAIKPIFEAIADNVWKEVTSI